MEWVKFKQRFIVHLPLDNSSLILGQLINHKILRAQECNIPNFTSDNHIR